MLDIPAALNELDRQPVEQLGMAGEAALRAEIIQRLDDPLPEHQLPQAVDHDPGGQGMIRCDQPAGQVEAVGPTTRDMECRKKRRHRGLDHLAGIVQPVAAR